MISKMLQQARDFEKKYHPYIDASKQPGFHVTGGIGWINDPNGFSLSICSSSTTPTTPNGDPCTGGM